MANSVVINYLVKVSGVKDVETLKAKLTNLTTAKGFQSAVMGVGMGVGLAAWNQLGNAIQGAGQWMADSVGTASDLAEAMNKARVVFGASTDAIDLFAETSATSLGISKRAAYEATGMFGNLFTTMGFGQEEAAAMSVDVTKLAADLGSFHNLGLEEVFDKLRAGLVGEAEPMRTLGVMLDAATVEAKALAMGLAKTKAEITASDKVTARYALILEQTANAQGDFGRTSDGLANSQKQLAAQMEDVQATIGTALIPIISKLANELETTLIPALQSTSDVLTTELPGGANLLDHALSALSGPFDAVKDNAERVSLSFQALQGDNEALISLFESMPGPMGDTGREMRRQSDAAKAAAKGATDMSAGLLLGKEAAQQTRGPVRDLATQTYRLADAAMTADEGWTRLSENIDNSEFFATYRDKMNDLHADVRAGQAELAAAIAAADTAAARAARQRIAQATADMERLRLQFQRLRQEAAKPMVVPRSVIGPGQNSGGYQPRATGGTVWGGSTYLVGERGPELFVPQTTGTIVPNAGGAPVNIAVYLDSDQIAARVERRQYFAASVAPVSAR